MCSIVIGDIVARKSHGADIPFIFAGTRTNDKGKKVCILKGVMNRLFADSLYEDLVAYDLKKHHGNYRKQILSEGDRIFEQPGLFEKDARAMPGTILHLDGSAELMGTCIEHYKKAGLEVYAKSVREKEQPILAGYYVRRYNPDVVVMTGHDGMKKSTGESDNLNLYSNSRYFAEAAKAARKAASEKKDIFIFAGACQSYYEAIIAAGANFASSPGRILIKALDPAIVAEKVAFTQNSIVLQPAEIADLTLSGRKGVWGIPSRGQMK